MHEVTIRSYITFYRFGPVVEFQYIRVVLSVQSQFVSVLIQSFSNIRGVNFLAVM